MCSLLYCVFSVIITSLLPSSFASLFRLTLEFSNMFRISLARSASSSIDTHYKNDNRFNGNDEYVQCTLQTRFYTVAYTQHIVRNTSISIIKSICSKSDYCDWELIRYTQHRFNSTILDLHFKTRYLNGCRNWMARKHRITREYSLKRWVKNVQR